MSTKDTRVYNFKIILAGDKGVGKSTILESLGTEKISEKSSQFVGITFYKTIFSLSNTIINVLFWELDENLRDIQNIEIYKGSTIGIVVFDLTNRNTFMTIPFWVKKLKQVNSDIPIFLLGNKIDQINSQGLSEEVEKLLTKKYNMKIYFISANTGYKMKEVFEDLFYTLIKTIQQH